MGLVRSVYTYNQDAEQAFVSLAPSSGDATGNGLPQRWASVVHIMPTLLLSSPLGRLVQGKILRDAL